MRCPNSMSPKRAFGLDLSGYAGDGSGLAQVMSSHGYVATVYRGHPFANRAEGRDYLSKLVAEQRAALTLMIEHGTVLVDVPIDLQTLPIPTTPVFVWQLTARPIDFAYGALRPFADRIGAPVARFQHLVADASFTAPYWAGRFLETYPAASLQCAGAPHKKYKDQQIRWGDGKWHGGPILAEIAEALRLVAEEAITLTDNDIDAISCALADALPQHAILSGEALALDMRARLMTKSRSADRATIEALEPPRGYQLFAKLPETNVTVRLREWPSIAAKGS